MSAEAVAGPKQAGKSRDEGEAVWYGRQAGQVYLSDRKVRVERPRLRRRDEGTGGELEVPAYVAMRRPGPLSDRMLEILMAGVSTRKYEGVIGEMADTVGVSKSAVSRSTIEASERVLKELMERRLEDWGLLVIYIDGIQFGTQHVLAAVGVDSGGKKHVLGVRQGASENAEVTCALLEDLVERGLDTGRRRLFVIDGAKALRKAIDQVFGPANPVQRCRNHKLRNVLGHLPKDTSPCPTTSTSEALESGPLAGDSGGRAFSARDVADAPPVAIVNRRMADEIWPGETPIGKLLRSDSTAAWTTVVGIVSNVRHQGLDVPAEAKLYLPAGQSGRYPTRLVIRARGDLGAVTQLAREAVAEVSPTTPVRGTTLLDEAIDRWVAVPRFRTLFAVGLATLAGILALLGLYGVVTFSVNQKTREIGVRMALGARREAVVGRVVASGLKLAMAGIVIGVLTARGLSSTVVGFLYEVEPGSPATLALIALVVAGVSAAAAYLPARRASRIDPMTVLNSE